MLTIVSLTSFVFRFRCRRLHKKREPETKQAATKPKETMVAVLEVFLFTGSLPSIY
jgi:hypothetical protein